MSMYVETTPTCPYYINLIFSQAQFDHMWNSVDELMMSFYRVRIDNTDKKIGIEGKVYLSKQQVHLKFYKMNYVCFLFLYLQFVYSYQVRH